MQSKQQYEKYPLSKDISIQILNISEQSLTAKLWFTGEGSPVPHHHESEEVNVFISGEFVALKGEVRTHVIPGDIAFVESNVEHNLICLSGQGEVITTWTPPRQEFIDKFA
ncbi:MAG: cupin domain-containing protein [Vibrio sp.]